MGKVYLVKYKEEFLRFSLEEDDSAHLDENNAITRLAELKEKYGDATWIQAIKIASSAKVYIVLSTNEYSHSTSDIIAHGVFLSCQDASEEADKVQSKLDKSTSLGWQVWIEESDLIGL